MITHVAKTVLLFVFMVLSLITTAQSTYEDSMKLYIKDYVDAL